MDSKSQKLTIDNQLYGEVFVESMLAVAQSKSVVPRMLYIHFQDCEFVLDRVKLNGMVY